MIKKAVIISLALAGTAFVGSMAHAGQNNSILECTKIADDSRRLACFDSAAKNIPDAVAGQNTVKAATPTREEKIANFGKTQLRESPVKKVREEQKKAEEKELKDITLKVVKYTYTASKKFVLFMENGQVWKQKEDGRIRLPKGEFEVRIKKGAFSGYNMIVPTKKTIIKVKRLR
ncbi:hypothetical protein MNBD_ALPHA01-191 [hydrothermal vent metagenome]|uniref:Uncharacterized protein n=1 Tax=hydrothermal vent metagenome TaxID=652676 RepID=A0A3B0SAF0_9ZZZZ